MNSDENNKNSDNRLRDIFESLKNDSPDSWPGAFQKLSKDLLPEMDLEIDLLLEERVEDLFENARHQELLNRPPVSIEEETITSDYVKKPRPPETNWPGQLTQNVSLKGASGADWREVKTRDGKVYRGIIEVGEGEIIIKKLPGEIRFPFSEVLNLDEFLK